MRRTGYSALTLVAALALALLAGGCAKARGVLGLEKSSPDEFAVVSQAPLAMPPSLDLRPPKAGAPRPQDPVVRDQARDALLANVGRNPTAGSTRPGAGAQAGVLPAGGGAPGAPAPAAPGSAGEQALLNKVGTAGVNPSIRVMVDRETALFSKEDLALTERLMFWADWPEPGVVVDPEKEAQRLRTNAAVGRPASEGEVPIIQRRTRALLEGLF
ncbi:MAG: DUF3035 domain-containing protein [Alphaproteobacteria bacterium]|nr:DUF3035 domain-containing protein [Alphaproteobacteria bacterium]